MLGSGCGRSAVPAVRSARSRQAYHIIALSISLSISQCAPHCNLIGHLIEKRRPRGNDLVCLPARAREALECSQSSVAPNVKAMRTAMAVYLNMSTIGSIRIRPWNVSASGAQTLSSQTARAQERGSACACHCVARVTCAVCVTCVCVRNVRNVCNV